MFDPKKMISIFEESGLKPEQIDEVMVQFSELKDNPIKEKDFHKENEILLKLELEKSVDWRTRAGIAAMIISQSLDD